VLHRNREEIYAGNFAIGLRLSGAQQHSGLLVAAADSPGQQTRYPVSD